VAACHHPSYVYAARFCPGPDGVRGETDAERALSACAHVITGCYDHNIRLWDVRREILLEKSAQILKVVQGHKAHINSIVIDPAKTKVYSADGIGQVRVWQLQRHSFECLREVNDSELKGDPINCLRIDRTGKQLVVLARDNSIRLFDTDRWTIIQRFAGLRCTQQHIRCDLSPDGKYLMSGSEDGQVYVWNVDSGELDVCVGTSRLPQMKGLCTDVAWNPAERIIAACAFSRRHPILVHR
jgi:WD40 repeat protein